MVQVIQDVNDVARPGRPSNLKSDENIEAMKQILIANRQSLGDEAPEDVGTSPIDHAMQKPHRIQRTWLCANFSCS